MKKFYANNRGIIAAISLITLFVSLSAIITTYFCGVIIPMWLVCTAIAMSIIICLHGIAVLVSYVMEV